MPVFCYKNKTNQNWSFHLNHLSANYVLVRNKIKTRQQYIIVPTYNYKIMLDVNIVL